MIGKDACGKRALYSGESPPTAAVAGIVVECSRCQLRSTVGFGQALRVLIPSVHVLFIRLRYPSLLRCPACKKISWVRLGVRTRSPAPPHPPAEPTSA
jgi:hypothetical protein